jgi:hypothetical protein
MMAEKLPKCVLGHRNNKENSEKTVLVHLLVEIINSFIICDIHQILVIEENEMVRACSGKKEYRKCEIHSNANEDLYAT